MEVSRIRALRGPNLWSRHTAIQAIVSCNKPEPFTDNVPDFFERLQDLFPQISLPERGRDYGAMTLAHAVERAALCLQITAGCPVTFSKTIQTLEEDVYQIIIEYSEEAVGRLAIELSQSLCCAAIENTSFNAIDAVGRLRELNEDIRLGPSTGAIVRAAVDRGIPFRRLTDGSMVQFGWGNRQRRILAAETDLTGAVAESIAQDKELTRLLLSAAGIPVPRGRPVINAEDAWMAACEIGGQIVVKPRDGNQGKGVGVNLAGREQVETAYRVAAEISGEVLVEQYIPGQDYRMLVIGNKLIAAARRDPPQVTGDGVSSVFQLVEQVNSDPRRGEGHANALTRISFDEIALAHLATQGLTAESIPPDRYESFPAQ